MDKIWDEYIKLIGRALARRWLLQQEETNRENQEQLKPGESRKRKNVDQPKKYEATNADS